jgi:hypothetical protein
MRTDEIPYQRERHVERAIAMWERLEPLGFEIDGEPELTTGGWETKLSGPDGLRIYYRGYQQARIHGGGAVVGVRIDPGASALDRLEAAVRKVFAARDRARDEFYAKYGKKS